jgi:hypothetical protein
VVKCVVLGLEEPAEPAGEAIYEADELGADDQLLSV